MNVSELIKHKGQLSGADYGEIRVHDNMQTMIRLLNGNVVGNAASKTGGLSARVYKNGCWGMSSSPDKSSGGLSDVVKAAVDNASFLGARLQKTRHMLPEPTGIYNSDYRTKKPFASPQDKQDFLKSLDDYITSHYKNLMSRMVMFFGFDSEKTLVTSDGSESYTYVPRAHLYLSMALEKDGAPIDLMANTYGGLGQFEDFFGDPSKLYPVIDKLYEDVSKKREGVYPEAGLKECILAPDLAGILAHEAVGHTVEADSLSIGSIAADLLNKKVASDLVSIVDYANTAFGEICPVPIYVDDEGVKAEDAKLIENGVLVGYMHNRESAERHGVRPTGNGRAFEFGDEPLIRMRNTCILPGTSKLEDMIADVEDGYLLSHPSNGQADMTSEFMFGITMGYEIKNGKLGKAILDSTVSGVAFDMLKTVTAVSNDIQWISSGFCGKKQRASVGMGGPAIRCKISIGGK